MAEADHHVRLANVKRLKHLREFKLQRARVQLAESNAALNAAQRSQDESQLRLEDNIDFREQKHRSVYTEITGADLPVSAFWTHLRDFDQADQAISESRIDLEHQTALKNIQETIRQQRSDEYGWHSKNLTKVDFLVDKTILAIQSLEEAQEEMQSDELGGSKRMLNRQ
jgi:hypothetical protein